MNPQTLSQLQADDAPVPVSLAERMDPAIGQATSVLGAMMTELLRRSLRGGVLQVGQQLQAYANEVVEATVQDRLPGIEQAAASVARQAARTAAADLVGEEVQALEQRTQSAARDLAAQVEEAARAAQRAGGELAGKLEQAEQKAAEAVAGTAQHLHSRIEEVEKKASEAVAGTSQHLSCRLEEVEKKTADAVAGTAQHLASRIEQAERKAEETTAHAAHAAQGLAGRIAETDQRVAATQQELQQEMQAFQDRARHGTQVLKSRIKALAGVTTALGRRLKEEHAQRGAGHADLQQRVAALQKLLEQERQARQAAEERLREGLGELDQACEALAARVAELERPRGLRALLGGMFGKRPEGVGGEPPGLSRRG